MHDPESPILRWLWPLLAAMAGSVTSLSFRSFKEMTPGEVAIALFVGASFSVFVTPIIVHMIYGPVDTIDLHLLGAISYIAATSWNILLPWLVRRIMAVMGGGKAEEPNP